jgi:hypothetical protein
MRNIAQSYVFTLCLEKKVPRADQKVPSISGGNNHIQPRFIKDAGEFAKRPEGKGGEKERAGERRRSIRG